MTVQEMIDKTSDLISATSRNAQLPCDRWKREHETSCVAAWPDKKRIFARLLSDKDAQSMCPACRAYYLLSMARNALIEHARTR